MMVGIRTKVLVTLSLVLAVSAGLMATPSKAAERPPVIWIQTAQANTAAVNSSEPQRGQETGLPIPRFASLRPDQVNARTGPGLSYPIDWIYQRAGLPVEITAEFDTWRRIRDRDQTETWVHQSMLSGRRGALVTDSEVTLRTAPNAEARPVARLQAGVVGTMKGCDGQWCEIDVGDHSGWLTINSIFGAYAGEVFR